MFVVLAVSIVKLYTIGVVRCFLSLCAGGILVAMKITVRTLEETHAFAEHAVSVLRSAGWCDERAVVLGLLGDLGAGKTAFVQCAAKVLRVSEVVTSSSFVLRSDYPASDAVFRQLIHIDAYRLERADEINTVGWGAVLAQSNTLVIVEWADVIADRLPADTFFITITLQGGGGERIFDFALPD